MPLSRRRTLAIALAVVAAGGGVALGAPIRGDDLVACRNKGQVQLRRDGWLKIMAPPVTSAEGPREVVDFAAPATTPKVLFATNGTVIKNSADGGCDWSFFASGLEPPDAPGAPTQPATADIVTHLAAPSADVLWAAGYDDVGGLPRPHVYLYQNLDAEERDDSRVENGLPAVGRPLELLAVSQGASPVVYLLLEEPADPRSGSVDPTHHLYVTVLRTDPEQLTLVGTIWQEVVAPEGFGRIDGLALAPGGRQVWIRSATHYATTPDAAAADPGWVTNPSPAGAITALDVNSAGEALVTATDEQGVRAQVADRTGTVVGNVEVPVLATSMTHGRTAPVRVLSGAAGTWGYDQRARRWVDVTPTGAGALRNLTIGQGMVERILLGNTDDAIYRFDTYPGETFLPSGRDLIGGEWPDVPYSDITEPYLDVRPGAVTVKPGEVKEADVEFGMPPAPNPLDVFFVVDTTGSMQPAIDGLRKDIHAIASSLYDELGEDVCFGVGDVKDASASFNDVDKVYRTHQKIVCEKDPALPMTAAALKELSANGGGTEPAEAQTIALKEMVLGKGHPRPLVLPDQDAEFRDKAFKVAVLITDINFNQGAKQFGYYPTIDEAATVLKVNGVKVVSVLPRTNWDPALAHHDMAELAEATDSFAPEGGVDCDGDGEQSVDDIPAGAPLICETSGIEPNIGPAITSLLLGVVDPGTLAVHVRDPANVVREPIKGLTSRIMNLKRPAALPFTLPVSCTPAQDGKDLVVTLVPTARALPVGLTGTLVVRCRSVPLDPPPKEPPPKEPAIFQRPVTRQALAVALLPPANPPVQPISNVNLNAGFSQQEEQQFQLAAVTQGAETGEDEEIELAMTGMERRERATPAGAFVVATMTLAAGAALMLGRATRCSPSTSASTRGRRS